MWRGISLANKCLLLFGGAIVLIILAALSVSALRVNTIVEEGQQDLSRQLVEGWLRAAGEFGVESGGGEEVSAAGGIARVRPGEPYEVPDGTITLLPSGAVAAAEADAFTARAWRLLSAGEKEVQSAEWTRSGRRYRYARLHTTVDERSGTPVTEKSMIVLDRRAVGAIEQALVNLTYFFSAGLISLGLAVLVFYLITTRLILSPVRKLRETAELVREGDTTIRADLQTGDEFEELGDTFNQMLEAITASQQQLRAINVSLDLKVNELAERNVSLYEANKVKGEFLASVSHELRTPLNSIIGFAELLEEQVERDFKEQGETPVLNKRRRYLTNILTAGRGLLDLINGLLDMAKLEAGKVQVNVQPVNLTETCEALLALIRPLADRGGVELALELGVDIPIIETDGKRLQQIIFNLLSNAVKFTSEKVASAPAGHAGPAKVTLRCERIFGRASSGAGSEDRVRISVLDTGPGIAPEDQERIFEKFQQLDSGHTRRHAGTGLGLSISRELTAILGGEIQVDSELGRGSMFSVILPLKIEAAEAEDEGMSSAGASSGDESRLPARSAGGASGSPALG